MELDYSTKNESSTKFVHNLLNEFSALNQSADFLPNELFSRKVNIATQLGFEFYDRKTFDESKQ